MVGFLPRGLFWLVITTLLVLGRAGDSGEVLVYATTSTLQVRGKRWTIFLAGIVTGIVMIMTMTGACKHVSATYARNVQTQSHTTHMSSNRYHHVGRFEGEVYVEIPYVRKRAKRRKVTI